MYSERISAVVKSICLLFLIGLLPVRAGAAEASARWWAGDGSITKRGSWSEARRKAGLEARRSALAKAIVKTIGRDIERDDIARLRNTLFSDASLYGREVSNARHYRMGRRQIVRLWLEVDPQDLLSSLVQLGLVHPWNLRPALGGLVVDRTHDNYIVPEQAPIAVSNAVNALQKLGINYINLLTVITDTTVLTAVRATDVTVDQKIEAASAAIADLSILVVWEYQNLALPEYARFLFVETPVRLRYRVYVRRGLQWEQTKVRDLELDWRLVAPFSFLRSGRELNYASLADLVRRVHRRHTDTFAGLRWQLDFYELPLTASWQAARMVSRSPLFSDLMPVRIERKTDTAIFSFYSVHATNVILDALGKILPAQSSVTLDTGSRLLKVHASGYKP